MKTHRKISALSSGIAILFILLSLVPGAPGKGRPKSRVPSPKKAAEAPKIKADQAESNVWVFGTKAVLLDDVPTPVSRAFSTLGLGDKNPDFLWTCFSIELKSGVPNSISVSVSAIGLGAVAFASDAADSSRNASSESSFNNQCPSFRGSGGRWTNEFSSWSPILKVTLDQQERRIAVRIPSDLVPQPGGSVEGKILILEPEHKLLELPLKIEAPTDPIKTGFQWFGGIAIPALLSFILGVGAAKLNNKITAHRDESSAFSTFKDDEYDALSNFFSAYYATAHDDPDEDFAVKLNREMRRLKFLQAIPRKKRKILEEALERRKRVQIKQCLAELFAEWKGKINDPKK